MEDEYNCVMVIFVLVVGLKCSCFLLIVKVYKMLFDIIKEIFEKDEEVGFIIFEKKLFNFIDVVEKIVMVEI